MSELLFRGLARANVRRQEHAEGSCLFRQGGEVRMLHCVVSGEVHLVRNQADGSTLVLQRAGAGDIVAEASLFSQHYHCDGVAAVPSVTLVCRRSQLRRALREDAGLAEAWTEHLAHQVQAARLRAEIVSLRTVAERLDAWLSARGGSMPAKGGWISVAREIAVSPEALYRELARRRGQA